MTEKQLRVRHAKAHAAWEQKPSLVTARAVLKCAHALVDLSDDYQAALDEADDIIYEAEADARQALCLLARGA
jgi:hypothetical protein